MNWRFETGAPGADRRTFTQTGTVELALRAPGPNLNPMRSRTVIAVALVAAALAGSSPALAQTATDATTTTSTTTTEGGTTTTTVETTTAQALPPAPKPEEQIPRLDERTAFMVGRNTLKLGILAFEYGILRQLSIGSDPPAWAARAVMKILIPNLHIKYQFLDHDPI